LSSARRCPNVGFPHPEQNSDQGTTPAGVRHQNFEPTHYRRSAAVAPASMRAHIAAMHVLLTLLLVFAMLGVLCVLGLGFAQLIRGGDPRRSNKLMQMRVIMQAAALLILALLWMLSGR
jgi:hypothetical protein